MIEFVLATALKQGMPLFIIGDLVVAYFVFNIYKTKAGRKELTKVIAKFEKDILEKSALLNEKIDDKVRYGRERIDGIHKKMDEINDSVKTTQQDIKEILVLISRK